LTKHALERSENNTLYIVHMLARNAFCTLNVKESLDGSAEHEYMLTSTSMQAQGKNSFKECPGL